MLIIWTALFLQSSFFERPEFRPWEILKDEEGQRFASNQQIVMEEIGDLGRLSWVRSSHGSSQCIFSFGFAAFNWLTPASVTLVSSSASH